MPDAIETLAARIAACRLCETQFAETETQHTPRPVVCPSSKARILIAGQAPGARVHASGIPFDDPSGDRLRSWLGVDKPVFYDRDRIAIAPMAFCFPGYDHRGADLPPPRICAETWRRALMDTMPQVNLTIAIGQYAQRWHITKDRRKTLTETVRNWRAYAPTIIPLPHPSWRNTAWLKKNPWFEAEVLPVLRERVASLL